MKKKILTLVATGLMSATFFTACNKDKYVAETPQSAYSASANAQKTQELSLNNKLEADFSGTHLPGTDLQWGHGYCSVNEIYLHANMPKYGSVKYTSEHEYRHMDMQIPGLIQKINIPYGEYKKVRFTINLAPNPTDNNTYAFYLGGTYTENDKKYTVRFTINDPVEIKIQEKDVAVFSHQDLMSVFTVQVKDLAQSITPEMLHNADKSGIGNMILISKDHNQELYNELLANLDKSIKLRFE